MAGKIGVFLNCSVFALLPFMANAAGTYYNYNGTIQRNYGGPYADSLYNGGGINAYVTPNGTCGAANGGCNSNVNANANVRANDTQQRTTTRTVVRQTQPYSGNYADTGLSLNAGISHQLASWRFDMSTAGSKLHYDNINWNVFDASANYNFYLGNSLVRLTLGGQYGMQFGDSSMVDDDITGGGFFLQDWNVDLDDDGVADQVWSQQGHALSVGTSNDGNLMGVYAGIGLVDMWKVGSFRMTPSVGYRMFKYSLDTKRNYGISLDTANGATNYCQSAGGETQCLPFLVFVDDNNSPLLGTIDGTDLNGDGIIDTYSYIKVPSVTSGNLYVETENTYYYYQDGVSHSYEVEWTGPYLALDMEYDFSADDAINARLEFGLPTYTATADQPYRPDWQHPKSLEDKGGFGDAYHFGFLTNWMHSITNSMMLSVGVTFDYYHIGKADATSFLNQGYYTSNYLTPATTTNTYLEGVYGGSSYLNWTAVSGRDLTEDKAVYESNLGVIADINALAAGGWSQTVADEIESVYKSLGLRVGILAKF
ncbi:MAG: hypothetical protein IJS34_00750 [Alphaproteobacteria bacterium]|nr:hypothetical protein [Alphaproteobacteria bacterium]